MEKLQKPLETVITSINQKTGITPKIIKLGMAVIALVAVLTFIYYVGFANTGFELSKASADTDMPEQSKPDKQLSTEFDQPIEPEPPQAEPVVVYVTGAVTNPGLYTLGAGDRVGDAVTAAGGMAAEAAAQVVNLADFLTDGAQIHVPTQAEAQGLAVPQNASGQSGGTGLNSSSAANQAKVNINTADISALQTLDGIGPATAQKIVDYRKANGSFKSKEDLRNVSGIGEKKYAAIEAKITV